MLIPAILLDAAAKFASKDDTRKNLLQVRLQTVDGRIEATMTDGHRLHVLSWEAIDPTALAIDDPLYLHSESLPPASWAKKGDLSLVVLEQGASLQQGRHSYAVDTGEIGTFPPTEKIIPAYCTSGELKTVLAFDTAYLVDIAAHCKAGLESPRGKSIALRLQIEDSFPGLRIDVKNAVCTKTGIAVEIVHVIMPFTIDW